MRGFRRRLSGKATAWLGAAGGVALVAAGLVTVSADAAENTGKRLDLRVLQPSVERRNFPLERGSNFVPRRPRIVMPSPAAPRSRGSPALLPDSAAWYAYCAEKHPSFEAGTGLYTTLSGRKRPCRP